MMVRLFDGTKYLVSSFVILAATDAQWPDPWIYWGLQYNNSIIHSSLLAGIAL